MQLLKLSELGEEKFSIDVVDENLLIMNKDGDKIASLDQKGNLIVSGGVVGVIMGKPLMGDDNE